MFSRVIRFATMDGNIYGGGTVMLTHFVRTAGNAREFNPVF
jgi:hypothetical protein